MGTKQSEISRIEGARQNISIEKLSRFADAVGAKLDIRLDPV
jgi:transcriptional regulator with XRE-family HTH domain